jgi:hypothetical protein
MGYASLAFISYTKLFTNVSRADDRKRVALADEPTTDFEAMET